MIEQLGVRGVQVEELYDLEGSGDSSAFGFIFLFKWTGIEARSMSVSTTTPEGMFFARQEVANACATLAILHILLNSTVDVGPVLTNFRDFTQDLPADMRGLCLSNSLEIRQAHNEFGDLEAQLAHGAEDAEGTQDPFHYVAFVRKNGVLYELDGMRDGPVAHGAVGDEWASRVLEIVRERVAHHAQTDIRFSLMAVVADQREWLRSQPALASVLADEEAKWSGYRKRRLQSVPSVSAKVQDLLASLQAKGLLSK